MRPRYETEADRQREYDAARLFLARFPDLHLVKLPLGERADFAVLRADRLIGYIEVKTRTCTSRKYPTYILSRAKLRALVEMAHAERVQAGLIVQWRDQTGFISVGRYLSHATFARGGRTDRGDPHDVEIMAAVDISLFTFLGSC